MTKFQVIDFGVMDYRKAWELQQRLHSQVVEDHNKAYLIKVEHPPVLTLGKHAKESYLQLSRSSFKESGIDVVDIDRGGEVTAHEPGQIVLYPIFALNQFKMTPRRYIEKLERIVIDTLMDFDLEGSTLKEWPGVWLNDGKVCAVGVRLKDRATMHGLALNVTNNLKTFRNITPCGIAGKDVTSMKNHRPEIAIAQVFNSLLDKWQKAFGESHLTTLGDLLLTLEKQ